MKNCLFILCIFFFCTGGQAWADNWISLVDDSSAHDYNCKTVHANSTMTLELGLFSPLVNPEFENIGERVVTNVIGFECKLIPHEGVIILGVDFPVGATNVGQDGNLIVYFNEPIPVPEYGKTVLATVEIFFSTETSFPLEDEATLPCYMQFNTWVQVTEAFPAHFSGAAAFIDADDSFDPYVAADYTDGPDMKFNLLQAMSVSGDTYSWESLKALYR